MNKIVYFIDNQVEKMLDFLKILYIKELEEHPEERKTLKKSLYL